MITLKDLKKVKTYDDLEDLGIGRIICDISYRGGNLGFSGKDVAMALDISEYQLPTNFGAGCNYLGGGLRGSIFASDFSKEVTGRKVRLLEELGKACIRVYENIDNEEIPDDPIGEGIGRINSVRSAY
jgi:hypothetical protein